MIYWDLLHVHTQSDSERLETIAFLSLDETLIFEGESLVHHLFKAGTHN